jgi:hypothetical protein
MARTPTPLARAHTARSLPACACLTVSGARQPRARSSLRPRGASGGTGILDSTRQVSTPAIGAVAGGGAGRQHVGARGGRVGCSKGRSEGPRAPRRGSRGRPRRPPARSPTTGSAPVVLWAAVRRVGRSGTVFGPARALRRASLAHVSRPCPSVTGAWQPRAASSLRASRASCGDGILACGARASARPVGAVAGGVSGHQRVGARAGRVGCPGSAIGRSRRLVRGVAWLPCTARRVLPDGGARTSGNMGSCVPRGSVGGGVCARWSRSARVTLPRCNFYRPGGGTEWWSGAHTHGGLGARFDRGPAYTWQMARNAHF